MEDSVRPASLPRALPDAESDFLEAHLQAVRQDGVTPRLSRSEPDFASLLSIPPAEPEAPASAVLSLAEPLPALGSRPTLIFAPEPAAQPPSAIPELVTHSERAGFIVIRCPKPPTDLKYSWWTLDALDSDEIDDARRLWVQVGFTLKSPVFVTEYGEANRPRPGPIKFFRDVSAALARRLDGKPIVTFKNPDRQFGRFPIQGGDAAEFFTLRELSAMVTTRTDRSRAGGQSKSPRKVETSRANLALARVVKHSGDAERQERLRRYEAVGLTIKQIAELEGVSYDAARMALNRARERGHD